MPNPVVDVALYDGWADWEIGHLIARVQNPLWHRDPGRFRIQTVSVSNRAVVSMGGLTVVPDRTADQITPEGSAMLVLPGADAWARGDLEWAARLAWDFKTAGVPVAAICGATFGLAAEGFLNDRRHTSAAKEYLAASGYKGSDLYVDQDVVTDRGVITAGPVDALPFARAALKTLGVFDPEVLNAWYRVFTEHDASAFGFLAKTQSLQSAAR